ncbi:MAG: RecX family transcriptional regulator [Bacteroidales bacterium]|jgi:regulatory protein|nr:RecX family transcriptional regulator [Bacteroidales bacterium]MCI2121522.1 RecX family transcriptional regulator [Bacteroidales bacterium]MCI2145536.1 RecX family transcriptional regulator [Bacteroidales bacterium]
MDGERILERMMRLCSMREYCISDISAKISRLANSSGEAVDREAILKELQDQGYLNEDRFAAAFARDKSALDGWGPAKITFALRKKGVSSQAIERAIGGIDEEKAGGKLKKMLAAKSKSLEGDPMKRSKLIKYALSRGYGYDQIKGLI